MCFAWISEQRAIISLYSTNLSVFIIEAESVYCAVRTGFLNQTATVSSLSFWRWNYFFLILAYPVYKMWIIQEPNVRIMKQIVFWRRRRRRRRRRRNGEYIPRLKYSVLIFVEKIYKMQRLEVGGAVRPSVWVVRRQGVKTFNLTWKTNKKETTFAYFATLPLLCDLQKGWHGQRINTFHWRSVFDGEVTPCSLASSMCETMWQYYPQKNNLHSYIRRNEKYHNAFVVVKNLLKVKW